MADVKKELIKTADIIRKKYRALKRGRAEEEELRLENLKPIVQPLQELVEAQKSITPSTMLALPPPPVQIAPVTPDLTLSPPHLPQIRDSTTPVRRTITVGDVAKKYLSISLRKEHDADHTYGVRYEDPDFKIGNKIIEIKDDAIIIDNITYTGTIGLWELIALKTPKEYNEGDLKTYKELLLQTSAHLKGFRPDAQVSANRHSKYQNIIKPLFVKTGSGLMEANDNKIDYRYWDDPNEMVDQLRILYLSMLAGNTGVHNEIESIIEELREKKIIFTK